MYWPRVSIVFILIFALTGAFPSADILSNIPRDLLGKILGNVRFSPSDIEKQEVIEIPFPTEMHHRESSHEHLLPKISSTTPKGYLPTLELSHEKIVPKESLPDGNSISVTENTSEDVSIMNEVTTANSTDLPLDANDVRNADQRDE